MKTDAGDLIASTGLASKSSEVPPRRSPYGARRRTGPRAPRPYTEVNYVEDPDPRHDIVPGTHRFRRVVSVRMLP